MKVTHREKEVINLIAQELTTKEIAAQLYISNSTVTSHRKNAMEKLKAKNTAGLISKSYRHGILELFSVMIFIILFFTESVRAQELGLEITGNAEIGLQNSAKGNYSTAIGFGNIAKGFGSTVIGQLNDSILLGNQNAMNDDTPLLIVGNGTITGGRDNALSVFGSGRMKLGEGTAAADLHIKQSSSDDIPGTGGIILENANDNFAAPNWQIYNSGNEISFALDGNRRAYINSFGTYVDDEIFVPNSIPKSKAMDDAVHHIQQMAIVASTQNKSREEVKLDAAQFLKTFPNMVIYDDKGEPFGIDYKQLYLTAIAALQQEIKTNEVQTSEIKSLKEQMAQIKDYIKSE